MKGALITILITFFVASLIVGFTLFFGGELFKSSPDAGILKSEDGGVTWSEIEGLAGVSVKKILFDQSDSSHLYVATDRSGLWIGENDGQSWTTFESFPPKKISRIFDIYEINDAKNALLAAVFQDNKGRLFYVSDDEKKELFFTSVKNYGIFGVAGKKLSPNTYWIISSDGGFYESQNAGQTWKVVKRFSYGLLNLVQNPRNEKQMWIITSKNEVIRTNDGGKNWINVSGFKQFKRNQKIQELFFDSRSNTLFLASDYGLLQSKNYGSTWSMMPLIIPPEELPITAVAVDPANSWRIFAVAQNQLYSSEDGGISWHGSTLPTSNKISQIAINPKNSNIIYLGLK